MNARRLLCIGITNVVLVISCSLTAAEGDREWKRVEEIVSDITSPSERVETPQARIARLQTSFAKYDAACAAALKVNPRNPERYSAAIFDAMCARLRESIHVPSPAKDAISLSELSAAPDIGAQERYLAGYYEVLSLADQAESPGGDPEKWMLKAEQFLKKFPDQEDNSDVESRMKSIKNTAHLRSQPLDWKFTAMDGRPIDLAKLKGKVVLIDFWATWCGPCVEELPNVIEAYNDLHDKGFEVVGISLDTDKDKLQAFVKEHGMKWPQLADGKEWDNEFVKKYEIDGIPTMWLLNKQGILVSSDAVGFSAIPNSVNLLKSRVEELLAQ